MFLNTQLDNYELLYNQQKLARKNELDILQIHEKYLIVEVGSKSIFLHSFYK
ncbi:MAG: hypothetical protein HCA27_10605 [Dolichospermum sp. DET67]|nr:hypothetical protein [Dolichospermum sp. DET67]